MAKLITPLFLLFFTLISVSQENLAYFLPSDVTYDEKIPTPESYFNMQMGEWHLTHDQVLAYIKEIDRVSDRAILQEYARSYENRPLVHLIFTSEENQRKLDELKKIHFDFSEPGSKLASTDVPMVISLGYGVHGNESSATNASVLTVYYLAAAQGEKINALLNKSIILVDPCLNPDGFTRHSTWANMHQSATEMGKTDSRQYREVWPGGRFNHYWFDLNRDYLLLVNPESRGRVKKFHEWKPNVVTDHHEMDANSTFFFQPGVKSRNNPLTPDQNYELTHEIAQYHARFLDKIGAPYFTEEQFDDYYFGKGSSYPDVNGSIGILFEQAGFRGRIRGTSNGTRKLAYGIRNQFVVTLSTLEAALNIKDELLKFQQAFYADAIDLAKKDDVAGYVFGSETDKIKTQKFIGLLNQHQIKVSGITKEISAEGKVFKPGTSFFVATNQKQYRLIKSVFETVSTFTDSTFYDVSTWTLPYAFGLDFAKLNSRAPADEVEITPTKITGKVVGGKSNLAYVFRWNEYNAPQALYQVQQAGLATKVANEPFSLMVGGKPEQFIYGTIQVVVPDPMAAEQIYMLVAGIAEKTGIDFYAAQSGLTPTGADLGSGYFATVQKPEVLMLAGGSANSSDAGEIWHLFDQRYQIPVCLTESNALAGAQLEKYNVLILPGGLYSELTSEATSKVKDWVKNGGTLIALGNASSWTVKNELSKIKFKKTVLPDTLLYTNYSDRPKEMNLNTISGAIFNAEMDLTHPLCYGYQNSNLPVFKTSTQVAESLNVKYAEPVNYTKTPFISGFVSTKNLERIKNTPVVTVESFGTGKIISYHDEVAFRGIWLATNKLFINSVFFGKIIR